MSEQKSAKFDTLPGNIIINSLYIPGHGSSHLIMGQANSKREALSAIQRHMSQLVHFGRHEEAIGNTKYWTPIPPRETSKNEGGYRNSLPIRTQKGIELLGPDSTIARVYADDYVTGTVPWTISFKNHISTPGLSEEVHNRMKNYFMEEGNQKFSWRKRYVNV